MRCWKYPLLFCIGGISYMALELLWRGRSHWTMGLAGGTCFLLLGQLARLPCPFWCRCLAGACAVTLVELGVGLLFNSRHEIWDYRQLPMNLMGQVCLPFTLLWIPVSMGAMLLYRWLDSAICRACPPAQ